MSYGAKDPYEAGGIDTKVKGDGRNYIIL